MRVALGGLAALALLAGTAVAHPDFRPQDRWYFGIYGGVSRTTVGALSLKMGGGTIGPTAAEGDAGWAAGTEISYWPCDYFGMGLQIELYEASLPRAQTPWGTGMNGLGLRAGPVFKVAVPLRYVQPYLGVSPSGVLVHVGPNPPTAKAGTAGNAGGFELVFLAGLNVYVNRNLRLLVEYHLIPFDGAAVLAHRGGAPSDAIQFQQALTHLVVTGLSWSPEFFHRAYGTRKWLAVWLAVVAMGGAMGTFIALGGR